MNFKITALALALGLLSACDADTSQNKQTIPQTKQAVATKDTSEVVDTRFAKLNKYFDVLFENERVLGSFAIYENGQLIFDKAYIVEDGKLVETKDRYRYKIGSISKTFTATLVFQMIEAGKLSLDTKLSEYFPEIPNADKITVKMMLQHRSGLFNYTNHEEFLSYYQKPQTQETMVPRIKTYEPAFEPDTKGEYSNTNYLLLGYILENISGKDYGDLIAEKIAEPLGLKATYLEEDTEPEKKEVFSYNKNNGWQQIPQWEMSSADAAGALVSDTYELNKVFMSLFDGKLISKDSLAIMTDIKGSYGHGFFKKTIEVDGKEKIAYSHGGRIESFSSEMSYFPDEKIGIVSFTNADLYGNAKIERVVTKAAFGQDFEVPEFKVLELTEDQMKPYLGEYASDTHPLDIKIMIDDGKLLAQATGQGAFPLTAIGENKFEFTSAGINIDFDPENKQFVIKQGARADIFIEKSNAKKDKVNVDAKILESYVGLYMSDSFPLDIEVMIKDGDLYAQATGQGAFPLTAKNETEFSFALAGIDIVFDASKKQLAITQGGSTNILVKD